MDITAMLGILSGKKDYIGIVQQFIDKVFVHEAKKFAVEKSRLDIIIGWASDGSMQVMTYSLDENKVLRIIPSKELQDILMK
jgi:hypothetical protein